MTPIEVGHGTRDACVRVEQLIHEIFRRHRYQPELPFEGGYTECYRRDVLGLDPDERRQQRPQPYLFPPVAKSGILLAVAREVQRSSSRPSSCVSIPARLKALMALLCPGLDVAGVLLGRPRRRPASLLLT